MTDNFKISIHDGLASAVDLYDAFILDVRGVLHDGVTLYPGVIDTLERLTAADKPFVMLTNAPRRSAAVADAMVGMGMPQRFCNKILSSGEATFLIYRSAEMNSTDKLVTGFCTLVRNEIEACLTISIGRR